jgi:hypothetical protein
VVEYIWDREKEAESVGFHGVNFDDAQVAVLDRLAVSWFDVDHSQDEPRFVAIGRDVRGRYLAVVTSEGLPERRIISAPLADLTRHQARTTCG